MSLQLVKPDLTVFVLSHTDTDETGKTRCKTIGKMLNDKVCLEGMFPIVLNTLVEDGKFYFETQNNGNNTSKSPMGMFANIRIDNDLLIVKKAIESYN